MDRKIKKEVLHRKARWKKELLPRVQAATRPNASHLDTPRGLALLQHVSDGVNEVLVARPLNPFAFLAEYLRHAARKSHVTCSVRQWASSWTGGDGPQHCAEMRDLVPVLPEKGFPTGNYKHLDTSSLTIAEMMEICRVDEECAGFSTDGAMKRILPRKLSQLQPMKTEITETGSAIKPAGLYVKVYPSKADPVMNTGIITAIPDGRFGLVQVVLDGIAVVENVPLTKLSDRWKRIRIKLLQKKQEKKKRMVVIGGKLKALADDEDDEEVQVTGGDNDFEKLGEDEEEEELRRRWKRVRATNPSNQNGATGEGEEDDKLTEYLYEDQATKRVLRKEPEHTFDDPDVRVYMTQQRKQHYDKQQLCVALEARDAFRQVIALCAKEKAREVLVNQVHDAKKSKSKKTKKNNSKNSDPKPNFFSKWFK
ncbi:hypothetical protein FI667_g10830, partial [Globisporangium splendens]